MLTASTMGLDAKISQAREQLRLFIIRNELERLAANRMDVLQIRATSKTTGRVLDADETDSADQQDGNIPSDAVAVGVRSDYAAGGNHGIGNHSAHRQ